MSLFSTYVQADRTALVGIRQFQQRVRLEDSIAEEVVRENARAHVEGRLEKAIECMKRRTRVRDYSDLVRVSAAATFARIRLWQSARGVLKNVFT